MPDIIKPAVFFVFGVYLSERVSSSFAVIFFLSLILVLTIKAVFKHIYKIFHEENLSFVSGSILIAALALTTGVVLSNMRQDSGRLVLSGYKGRYITAAGRISELPRVNGENAVYVVRLREITHKNETAKVNEKVLLSAPAGHVYGDTVVFSGIVRDLPKKMNDNGFDYARYYKSKNIFFRMYSAKIDEAPYKIHDYSPYSVGLYIKSFISDTIDLRYRGDYAAIIEAVLTGNKKEFSDEFKGILNRTGLSRYYYPAYLHIMLFMALITVFLSFCSRQKRDMVLIVLLIVYALFNMSNAAVLRISVMLCVTILLRAVTAYAYYFDAAGITILFLGITNPLIFFDAGFVMSLLAGILVFYFFKTVSKRLKFIKRNNLRRIITVNMICALGLVPFSAYFWNGVSVIKSPIMYFVMIPCVIVILLLSPFLIAMLALFHTAPVVGWITSLMTGALYYIPIAADKYGADRFFIAKPDILILLIYTLLLVAAVKHIKGKNEHKYAALLAALALSVSIGINELTRINDIDITFVNVGQGDGAVISAPHSFNILIDGGGGSAYSDYDPGEKLFLEYLLREGIHSVDSAFVSHYHQDHAQGIVAAIENLNVKNVFMPDCMEGSEWRVKLEEAARTNGTVIHYIKDESVLRYKNGMTVRIIPPAKKASVSDDENDTSCICFLQYGSFSAMFTGDMSSFAERSLLEGGKVPNADLLKVAHHGSRSSTCREWVQALSPVYAVISVGENNPHNLPNKEALENLKGALLYRTDLDGDVRFTIKRNGKVKIR